jgi:hypothetical protein
LGVHPTFAIVEDRSAEKILLASVGAKNYSLNLKPYQFSVRTFANLSSALVGKYLETRHRALALMYL